MLYLNNLRKQLENIINNSGVPVDAAYYVIKDILNELTEIIMNEINKEKTENSRVSREATPAKFSAEEENKTNE